MPRVFGSLAVALLLLTCGPAPQESDGEMTVALLLAPSGKGDRSYNDMAISGLKKAQASGSFRAVDLLPASQADYQGVIRDLAEAHTDLIIGIGFTYVDAFAATAPDYGEASFLLIDGEVPDASNVRSIQFRPEEGSFLAGLVAARTSRLESVAFIGGMDIPIINRFRCGFEEGVQYANRHSGGAVKVQAAYVGSTPDAFANPAAGRDLARLLYSSGSDVIYHAAGKSGNGVIQAADEMDKFVIGVDTDQSYLAPEAVLTSMRKRIDLVVEQSIKDLLAGSYAGGSVSLGIKESGVDLVLDPDQGEGLPEMLQEEVRRLSSSIAAGELTPCAQSE